MAPNGYQKFSRHATPHLRASRHTWTWTERRNTILTVYHGNPTVRQHYATNNTEIPTLSTLFPNMPYTRLNVVEARSHQCMPDGLTSVQVPRTLPTTQAQLAQLAQLAQPATQVSTAAAPVAPSQSGTAYKHWPPSPWPYEPDLPHVGAGILSLPRQDAFLSTKPHMLNEESHWHGARFIGAGSSGAVGLWCEIDGQGNVVDRMVVKDNVAASREAWRDPKNWRDRLPREIAIHRRVESRRTEELDACQYISKYRGHRLLMSKRRFRLYMDYASGGNLEEAMKLYHRKWSGIDPNAVPTQDYLPETFIWYIIKALAMACLILQNGTVGNEPVADWRPIMHLDLQLPNVLLDVQNKKRKTVADGAEDLTQAGPSKRPKRANANAKEEDEEIILKLTDFGLSFFDLDFSHCSSLSENPHDHILPSGIYNTRYAPEHNYLCASDPDTLDEKTDVWGIGRVAWALIVNQLEPHGPVREGGELSDITGGALPVSKWQEENMQLEDKFDTEVLIGSSDWPASNRYSEELKALVRDCLRFWKELRPSLREVLQRVQEHLDVHPELMVGAMKVGNTGLVLPDNGGFEIGFPLIARRPGM